MYQLFEVLVGRLAQLLERDYRWLVTPLQGDRGIDLLGERLLFAVPDLAITATSIIVGQCKRSKGRIDLVDSFSGDIAKALHILEEEHRPAPTLVLLVAAGPIGDVHRSRALPILEKAATAPVLLLDAEDIVRLVSANLNDMEPLLRELLPPADARAAIEYFTASGQTKPRLEVGLVVAEQVEGGKPFDLVIQIRLRRPAKLNLSVRLEAPASPRFLGVRPGRLFTPSGLNATTSSLGELDIKATMVGYKAGIWPLGRLVVMGDGTSLAEEELESVRIVEAYHPPFFEPPHVEALYELGEIARRVLTGSTAEVIVAGTGGSGKTRLSQEFGLRSLQSGNKEFLSVSHTHTYDQPLKVIRDILYCLYPTTTGEPGHGELVAHVKRVVVADKEIEDAISLLVSAKTSEILEGTRRRGLIRLLAINLIDRLMTTPLILHLSDLHWATREVLTIIAEAADAVRVAQKGADRSRIHGLLVLYEGRLHEEGPDSYSTDNFEYFIQQVKNQDLRNFFRIPPLSEQDSKGFLQLLLGIEPAAEAEASAPEQQALLRSVLRAANGNPLYLIEFVRLLRQRGIARYDPLTGRHYLAQSIPSTLTPPRTVASLIRKRLQYLQRRNYAVFSLITAIGFLDSEINYELFQALMDHFTPGLAPEELAAYDIVTLPKTVGGEVRFRHESYFHVVNRMPMAAPERQATADVYLAWASAQEPRDAASLFFLARVKLRLPTDEARDIGKLLSIAQEAAKREGNLYLQERILTHQLDVADRDHRDPSKQLTAWGFRYELARLLTLTANWKAAQPHLDLLFRELDDPWPAGYGSGHFLDEARLLWAKTGVQLGNVLLHRLHHPQALRVLTKTQPLLRSMLERDDRGDRPWASVLIENLNREGVTAWFDGRYSEAISSLEASLELSRRERDEFLEMVQLIDLSAVRIHFNIEEASRELWFAERILGERVKSQKDELMAGIARARIQILLAVEKRSGANSHAESLDRIYKRISQIYWESVQSGFRSEQGSSALIAGVVAVMREDLASLDWFLRSQRVAFSTDNMELRWKVHMALAEFGIGSGNHHAARVHADLAKSLISADLNARAPAERRSREELFSPVLEALDHIERRMASPKESNIRKQEGLGDAHASLDGPVTIYFQGAAYFIQN